MCLDVGDHWFTRFYTGSRQWDGPYPRWFADWVDAETGAPGGERWEIYTVLADSPTFWGQDGEQRWDAVQAELGGEPAGQATQCCGGPNAADGLEESASSGVCCT